MIARLIIAAVLAAGVVADTHAQRGGGGRGGDTGGGGPTTLELSRLEILTQAFKLDKDQKTSVKLLLDAAHKTAAPFREGLTRTRAAISAAIQAGKSQGDIDDGVKQYAAHATAMTAVEMKALAQLLKTLQKEQASNAAAVQTAFFLVRGMFLSDKKWDIIPDASYRY